MNSNISDIKYELRISKRARKVAIRIMNGNVELVVPKNYSVPRAERFLYSKIDWINKHLHNNTRNFIPRYLGKQVKIVNNVDKRFEITECDEIDMNINYSEEGKEFYNKWLYEKAKSYLPERTRELADKYNFSIGRVSVRRQKTRWGSCSSKKNISLNYKLLQFEKPVIDYVIIHELCHTKFMNHSKSFWNEVSKIIPDYKKYNKQLKNNLL
ncbi:MAG: M48 family peptidase [Ignavibacteria bacterium]|nr:MAG: M48 family peptidase [Ignavibacteria bacterium]